jgi:hypothetical protein
VTVRDPGGTVIQRVPILTSSNTNIVIVEPSGAARAIAVGTAAVRATVEGVVGEAQITVVPATPAAATGLVALADGLMITLNWTDNANNETRYEIRRGPSGGVRAVVATLAPGVTNHVETAPSNDLVLDYSVAACNNVGCAESDVITTRTVPAAPSRLMIEDVNPSVGAILLTWLDNSNAETRFEVQSSDIDGSPWTVWSNVPGGTGATGSYSTTLPEFEYVLFRIVACNEAGCSPPSNEEFAYFGGCGVVTGAAAMRPRRTGSGSCPVP